jgi:hypothetical protein
MSEILNSNRKYVWAFVVFVLSLIVLAAFSANVVSPRFTSNTLGMDSYLFGTLQSDPLKAATHYAKGIKVVTVSLSWRQFEPIEGQINTAYVQEIKNQINQFKAAGMQVILSAGVQYTPDWIFNYPHSRFATLDPAAANPIKVEYTTTENGKKVSNMVFNQVLRTKQATYWSKLFEQFGTDFYAVRLGGGWYGEVNYPTHQYGGRTNAYWAFDDIAQGNVPAVDLTKYLPEGINVSPVPGWVPGMAAASTDTASKFISWYMDSQKNYHDWQIKTVRTLYSGNLIMMYPSWGVRPGDIEAAVASNLNGTTAAEVNGELQRGFDFTRYIKGITDPRVIIYTTWLEATGNDASTNPARWTPVKYLASLAHQHPLKLRVGGENGGCDSALEMEYIFGQMQKYGLVGVTWAFEPQLYGQNTSSCTAGKSIATIDDYSRLIGQYSITSSISSSSSSAISSSSPTSTAADTVQPTIAITNPLNGSTVAVRTNLAIKAAATDNIAVTKVEFWVNDVLICTDTTADYACNWKTGGRRNDPIRIKAIAYDKAGNSSESYIQITTK